MSSKGALREWKRFVKSSNNDDRNDAPASCYPHAPAPDGSGVRLTYEEIVDRELRLPDEEKDDDSEETTQKQVGASDCDDQSDQGLLEAYLEPMADEKHIHLEVPVPSLNVVMRHAERNDCQKVKEALNQNPGIVNAVDQYGWSILMVAACAGAEKVVELLLQAGADAGFRDKGGRTCLTLALKKGHVNLAQGIRKFCSSTSTTLKSQEPKKKKTAPSEIYARTRTCPSCDTNFSASQLQTHQSSTVHLLSKSSRGCRVHYSIPGNNRGYQIMLKEGWDGERGLGPSGSGVKAPPKTVLKRDRKGLGASKGQARITHFNPNDSKAVSRDDLKSQYPKRSQNKYQLQQEILYEKSLERSLRRELS